MPDMNAYLPDARRHMPTALPTRTERIEWQASVPFNPRHGDRYHSSSGARAQAEHVFLDGCGLRARWQDMTPDNRPGLLPGAAAHGHTLILETGFGLGLNFLSTWACWQVSPRRPGRLTFLSTEAYPVSADDIRRAAAHDPVLQPLGERLAAAWPLHEHDPPVSGSTAEGDPCLLPRQTSAHLAPGTVQGEGSACPHISIDLDQPEGRIELRVLLGDAHQSLRAWHHHHGPLGAQAVFLDGFNPATNPEIWSADTLKAVAAHCCPGARLATWCVARCVRDAVQAAGFTPSRRPGLPPKRHCLTGELPGAPGQHR